MRKIRTRLCADALADDVFAGNQIDASIAPLGLFLDQIFDFRDFLLVHFKIPPFT
jgi:hypothetical protein